MILLVLSAMLSLAPHASLPKLAPVVLAIDLVSSDSTEALELTTIAFVENTFTHGIPFGVSCCVERGMTLEDGASKALHILRRSHRICGDDLEARMSFFRTGKCAVDDEAEKRARIVRRLMNRFAWRST